MKRRQKPTEKAIRVVAAAILKGNRCLATQRAPHMSNPLEWEFPGGKVEPGEDPPQALVREIREELGVEIVVDEWLGVSRIHGAAQEGVEGSIELTVYTATLVAGEIRLAEHLAHGWFRWDEVDALQWSSADRPLLTDLKHLLIEQSSGESYRGER